MQSGLWMRADFESGLPMSEYPTLARFAGQIDTPFKLRVTPGESVDLVLIEATSRARGRKGLEREPFSLVFRAPHSQPLPQGCYRLEHETLGLLEIFLVPLGPEGDTEGLHYQALFT